MGVWGTLCVLALWHCPMQVPRALRGHPGCPRGCSVAREPPAMMGVGCHRTTLHPHCTHRWVERLRCGTGLSMGDKAQVTQ